MPRAIWKGSISFGLVNAPVAMYAAIDEQDLHPSSEHKRRPRKKARAAR